MRIGAAELAVKMYYSCRVSLLTRVGAAALAANVAALRRISKLTRQL